MLDFISKHWKEIAAVIAALVAGGHAIRFVSTRLSGSSNNVNQRGARAKGDMVGRDNNRSRRG
ncbi:hypothetical protein [Sphingomonas sp.]|uniref:hypothetical protein n=1 Tax=Sphingomonas sp. TaxID=28214 RepID=UPI003CC528CC